MIKFWVLALAIPLFLVPDAIAQKGKPIDKKATRETKALYKSLKKLSRKHTLFGHQHATEYGRGWSNEPDRSDVKSVTGSHPAVIGVDFSGFSGRPPEMIEKSKENLRKNVVDTYHRGGITTVAWHFSNPLSKGGFNWVDSVSVPAVKHIIPGGDAHERYKEILRGIGEWAHTGCAQFYIRVFTG
jgi:mannan endo-1,4-beta-mannosidase